MRLVQQRFEASNFHLTLLKDCDGVYSNPEARLAWVNWMTAYSFGQEDGRMLANQESPSNIQPNHQVPHITAQQLEAIKAILHNPKDLAFVNGLVDAYNKANAEQSKEQPLISAEEARKLGAGNAEWIYNNASNRWFLCPDHCTYQTYLIYQAIKQTKPVEQGQENDNSRGFDKLAEKQHPELLMPTCQVKNLNTGVTETLTYEVAEKLFIETLEKCDWSFIFDDSKVQAGMSQWSPPVFKGIYTYKQKENLVKLNGKLMSREAAIAEWESKKDTCDVHINGVMYVREDHPRFDDTSIEYEIRERQLKQIEWPGSREDVIALLKEFGLL